MKMQLTAKELIEYLDKKSSELEGDSILQQLNKIETGTLSTAEILNKMYEFGFERGKIMGKRDILLELAQMIKIDEKL